MEADKNVNARKRRFAFIPEEIIALGLFPVQDLIHYLTYYYSLLVDAVLYSRLELRLVGTRAQASGY